MSLTDVLLEDIEEVVQWITKFCETSKIVRILNAKKIPVATNARKLELARKRGIQVLEHTYRRNLTYLLRTKNVYSNEAQEVYAKKDRFSTICWQVAQSMAIAIDNGHFSEQEERQWTAAQWAVPELYVNLLALSKKLQKAAGHN